MRSLLQRIKEHSFHVKKTKKKHIGGQDLAKTIYERITKVF